MKNMQKAQLDNKKKSKILFVISAILITVSIPVFFPHFTEGHGLHAGIHIASIILGSFLSVIGTLTYLDFRTKRLFLMMCAFFAITTAEIVSAANAVFLFWPSFESTDSLITHGLILLMLSLFSVGIFRTD